MSSSCVEKDKVRSLTNRKSICYSSVNDSTRVVVISLQAIIRVFLSDGTFKCFMVTESQVCVALPWLSTLGFCCIVIVFHVPKMYRVPDLLTLVASDPKRREVYGLQEAWIGG
jgi:hypothetical protein